MGEVMLEEKDREEAREVLDFLGMLNRKQEKELQLIIEGVKIGMKLAEKPKAV